MYFLLKYNSINIFYNKKEKLKDNEINFNFDYFNFFDKQDFSEVKNKKSLILPYYFKSDFYKKNLIKKFENLRNEKKIYKIIFSGSHLTEWYDQLKWPSSYDNKKPIGVVSDEYSEFLIRLKKTLLICSASHLTNKSS